ncbi:toll/interleukin-1 receptor domain-containing protein [Flavobacterium salilacus subsp. salilacus]|uniref:toll/interleukin-1 receptor domain-containing protein n=1 Tax=Flavobacterium TaxID=237 RepID=UPI0010752056|nr:MULTISPECIES: toll/interleukin-1 receptor domain-containing protein [Flavobacterium]KAF2516309.1 toll/interleukin-1 receptor domain-containing protein [Flavobacterium salilacus subsp. salilacus]MBE1613840.1 toll/interleukin-1 receptor domain-containing protein [Flavobacterium sp. SaA2.13]
MKNLIFLSHIHEEKDLAVLVQKAIEDEFSGFVKVFVSSDGSTIPAGANFLKRIEDGLIECIVGIYLISPKSVKRNWINFELGAVWIRNVLNQRNGSQELPIIPFCHSGITPSELPMPLTHLNAIEAKNSAHLEFTFKSIQTAVGGSGNLKTDFEKLAQNIINFQNSYTLGNSLISLFNTLEYPKQSLLTTIQKCKEEQEKGKTVIELDFIIERDIFYKINNIVSENLQNNVIVIDKGIRIFVTNQKSINGNAVILKIRIGLILNFETELLAEIG